jgi:Xaa-Pro aminopeptidase
MIEQGCDLVVFGGCPNYQYLTGDLVDWREAPDHRPSGRDLFFFREGNAVLSAADPIADVPEGLVPTAIEPAVSYWQWASEMIQRARPAKIGIGANLGLQTQLAIIDAAHDAEVVDASHWLDETRAIKDREELSRMRAVAELTDAAMVTVVKNLQDGVSMRDLALQIEMEGRRLGASGVSFKPFAGFMKLGAGSPNDIVNVPFDQGLEPDTAICFDVGFVLDGYASDWGRSVYWGRCPQNIMAAYRALVDAVLETVSQMHEDSMRVSDVYPTLEKALDDRGFGEPLRRRLAQHRVVGHSIGVEVHESPWLGPNSDFVLKEGMTVAIEPKLWVPGEYYLRLEEIVLVGKYSSEFLTNFDRDLFVL